MDVRNYMNIVDISLFPFIHCEQRLVNVFKQWQIAEAIASDMLDCMIVT